MDRRFLNYARENAPRYTSYPAAPHFSDAVTPATFRSWLAALDETDTDLSLYVHIPYCREICAYCACNTFAVTRDSVLTAYTNALRSEIDLIARTTPARRVREIHWGGGTPNVLSPEAFEKIVLQLEYWFDLGGVREHAVEIDPRALTAAHAQMYGKLGVNRASLGVQDLNDHVQRAIKRVQPYEVVAKAADLLRRCGVEALNFDLMYGLPGQSVEDVRRTVRQAVALQPNRIAVFGYAHVPWFKTRQRLIDETALPATPSRVDQAEAAREELLRAGYRAIGFDHYALPDDSLAVAARTGGLRRNFQGYVDDPSTAVIGLGASAISTLPQGYAQNARDPGAWAAAIEQETFATVRGHALTEDDRRRRFLIETLLCRFSVDLAPLGGRESFQRELAALAACMRDGVVALDGDKVVIPAEARPLARLVARAFDRYEPQSESGRSTVS